MAFIAFPLLSLGCHELPAAPVDGVQSEPPAVEQTIVDHGDGTWSYTLAGDFDPSAGVVEGPVTWSYVEQARFSWDPQPSVEETYIARADEELTLAQQLIGSVRLDRDGRFWEVMAVDEALAADIVAQANAESVEIVEVEDEAPPEEDSSPIEEPGDVVTWIPLSWTTDDCDNSGGLVATQADNHYWNGDDRVRVDPAGMTDRQKAVVVVLSPIGRCSGVIIRSKWVLTGAHCVHDVNDNPIPDDDVTVVRMDGVGTASHDVDQVRVSPYYNSEETNVSDDYALLQLTAPLEEPFFDMDLSGVSEDSLKELDKVHNVAIPGSAPGCDSNSALKMFTQSGGPLGRITKEKINLKLDAGPGHSGSPAFYCPDGDDDVCADRDTGFVIAAMAGWDPVATTFKGPRVSRFREWAITLMDGT